MKLTFMCDYCFKKSWLFLAFCYNLVQSKKVFECVTADFLFFCFVFLHTILKVILRGQECNLGKHQQIHKWCKSPQNTTAVGKKAMREVSLERR